MTQLKSEKKLILNASTDTIWKVLTESEYTKQYMFNCSVESSWQIGDTVIWEGEFEGYKAYQKGKVIENDGKNLLKYSTFDPNFGLEDKPENYIHVTYILENKGEYCELLIINETFDANNERMQHINQGWDMVVSKLKEVAEHVGKN